MQVHSWDEVSGEWATHELNIESINPTEINRALGASLTGGDGDGFMVETSRWFGPVLFIEARDDVGHLAIMVVITEPHQNDHSWPVGYATR